MKFCPKCGGMMLPKKEGSETYLQCTKCGYKMKPSERDKESYREKEVIAEEKKVGAGIVEGAIRSMSKEERELLEDYYKQFLENYLEAEGEQD